MIVVCSSPSCMKRIDAVTPFRSELPSLMRHTGWRRDPDRPDDWRAYLCPRCTTSTS